MYIYFSVRCAFCTEPNQTKQDEDPAARSPQSADRSPCQIPAEVLAGQPTLPFHRIVTGAFQLIVSQYIGVFPLYIMYIKCYHLYEKTYAETHMKAHLFIVHKPTPQAASFACSFGRYQIQIRDTAAATATDADAEIQ